MEWTNSQFQIISCASTLVFAHAKQLTIMATVNLAAQSAMLYIHADLYAGIKQQHYKATMLSVYLLCICLMWPNFYRAYLLQYTNKHLLMGAYTANDNVL